MVEAVFKAVLVMLSVILLPKKSPVTSDVF